MCVCVCVRNNFAALRRDACCSSTLVYTSWWQRHVWTTYQCRYVKLYGRESNCWSQVQCHNHYTIMPWKTKLIKFKNSKTAATLWSCRTILCLALYHISCVCTVWLIHSYFDIDIVHATSNACDINLYSTVCWCNRDEDMKTVSWCRCQLLMSSVVNLLSRCLLSFFSSAYALR